MKKAAKILSLILILASGFGLFGGSMALTDAMNSKSYWENAGSAGDSLNQLEDGLNALAENEDAYYDGVERLAAGRREYEAGVKKLEEGQAEYDAGKKLLEEKQAEYDEGLKKLEEAETTLWQARQDLENGEQTYAENARLLEAARPAYQAGVAKLDQLKELIAGVNKIAAAYSGEFKPGFDLAKANALVGSDGNLALTNTAKAGIMAQVKAELNRQKTAMEEAGQTGSDQYAQIVALLSSDSLLENYCAPQFAEAQGKIDALKKGRADLTAGIQKVLKGVSASPDMASKLPSDQVSALQQGLAGSDEQFCSAAAQFISVANSLDLQKTLDEGQAKLNEFTANEAKLAAARKQLDDGYVKYQAGLAEYYDGLHALQDGKRQLDEGYAKLEAAGKELEAGKKQLADAERQLADGEAQLAEFEDGRDQVIDGLNQVLATESYPGIPGIAERLGSDYSFMKDKENLDIDKGLEAVAAARAFSAETTAAVTREVVSKVAAALLTMFASVSGAVGGVVGLVGKAPKASGILGLVGAVSAAAGLAVNIMSGGVFSAVAGSSGPALMDAASGVLAAGGAAQSVASFIKPKAPAPAP